MTMTVTEYADKASEIFVLSESFIRIKELIDDESSTIDDISDVIILDPALTGTILKLANSSFFNYPGKIDTISKAVLVLGITEVYNLVIAYFTTQAFKDINAEPEYLENFWEETIDCALLVKYFGCNLNMPNAERLFILGVLHNLGELIVKQISPEIISEYTEIKSTTLPWNAQKDLLGFTFGECTAELLKLWYLPYNLVSPIRHQDNENFNIVNTETQLLYIAKRLMIHNRDSEAADTNSIIDEKITTDFGIDEEMLTKGEEYCNLERLGILAVLSPSAVTIY